MAENVGRTKFFAISSDEKGESVLVWRFITSQSGVPTTDIVFFKANRKSSGKELLLECVKVSSEHGIKNYHITIDYAIDIEMGLLKNFGFVLKRVESRDVLTTIAGATLDRLKVLDDADEAARIVNEWADKKGLPEKAIERKFLLEKGDYEKIKSLTDMALDPLKADDTYTSYVSNSIAS